MEIMSLLLILYILNIFSLQSLILADIFIIILNWSLWGFGSDLKWSIIVNTFLMKNYILELKMHHGVVHV